MPVPNPYAAPSAEPSAPAPAPAPAIQGQPLFTEKQIFAAAFIGTPLAGGALLALNYRRLGQINAFAATVGISVLGTAAVFALAFQLPDNFPNVVLPLAYSFALRAAAAGLQGKEIKERVSTTHRISNYRVAAIAGGGLFVALIALVAVMLGIYGRTAFETAKEEHFQGGATVHYYSDTGQQQAQRLGNGLVEAGWFGEQPSSAELRRDGEQYVGCLVVVQEAWNDEAVRNAARAVQEHLRQGAFKGQRFRVELCDASLEVHGRL